ncbi:fatty acyl-AMP ligase [Mycolicibacterium holsaticum]|jgi:acyl-CoA synthetase (AMP-forming)/AMP-acid ligase II|uniref:Fatty-acid--CoA ligase n=1 Tax=Mycolicibacterium holsaticum TaxID=152142 RepID=A0A1E3RZE0_9MYCO|nr:fatty acyl-AMP ligase [Mycolicibacterium holsaticum]MDA4108031.1 nitrate ABC transporter substrate-binding protein [Mycolicibacterium holsaticum DSM 44478 = JCM 12374]ODQ95204.1 fatty-acid--CoA ligase [Mycolicibacterium holsaticum]QZA14548.1 AMP-binding protein [Mycolicibacterium holsaticum DSM 44478 = JCM 12374]UNC08006.1 AMP-binding protein [Mycolicibacterium holsaticum DSM 44478 = JCM 12374]
MKLGGSIEDYLDSEGHIVIPEGVTLTSHLESNIAELRDSVAFRFLDYRADPDGSPVELTWHQLDVRLRAVGARLQQVTSPGDRVAILAPQGIDYIVGLFAAIAAGNIAVPLFAPELPGHAERLRAVIGDAEPTVVLTSTEGAEAVHESLVAVPRGRRPRVIAVDALPDSVGELFTPFEAGTDDIAYLQYTSGSTRTPAGVEVTHRAVCTNVAQMVLSVGLDHDIRSVSWLPLFHDMGLLMVMFPALCGGQLSLMSPMAFVRRPYRWIRELAAESKYGRTFAAAPNFAFELAAQRGLPPKGEHLDLSNVGGLINGSEPVSIGSIDKFNEAFGPYGLPPTTIKPSYGMAEATLFVSTIAPDAEPKAVYLDREQLGAGRAVEVPPDAENAVPQVSCGRVARSQWAVIVDPNTGTELPDGQVGEIWLHGANIGRGYWGRADQTEAVFQNKLQSRLDVDSHAEGAPSGGYWLRTGDLGMYHDGGLYIVGRIKDMIIVDGRNHYPQDLEATAAGVSPAVRAGFVVAFGIPDGNGERLVIVAERAPGAGKADPQPVADAIRAAVSRHHALPVADVKLVAAGTIPRTTSGKLARRACRAEYLEGKLGPVAG